MRERIEQELGNLIGNPLRTMGRAADIAALEAAPRGVCPMWRRILWTMCFRRFRSGSGYAAFHGACARLSPMTAVCAQTCSKHSSLH